MRFILRFSCVALMIIAGLSASAQTYFWTETFGTGCNQNQLATSYTGSNGSWTMTSTGPHTSGANNWFVSATENGMTPGQCGAGCGSDRSLHIANTPDANWACFFCPTGDCGAAYADASAPSGFCTTELSPRTNRRVESPTINCTGRSNITLSFNYIEGGDGANDNATVEWFNGSTWAPLTDPAKTTTCPGGQGRWIKFTFALPAGANNNANVKIGFRWVNNADDVGTDPSIAIDSVQLSEPSSGPPPTAAWSSSDSTFCAGTCINFTDLSTNTPTNWTWYFPGGTPNTSTSQNPSNICYNTPGTYPVTLVVSNANGQDSVTMNNFITVQNCPPPSADFSASDSTLCEGQCINFFDLSTGTPTNWTWYFPGATPTTSNAQNPTGVCYAVAGTYTVHLVASNGNGQDSIAKTAFITVQPCGPPIAGITQSATEICEDNCITYSDNSTDAASYQWTFQGGSPGVSNSQNPGQVCYATPGVFTTTLVVFNPNGSDTTTTTITVNAAPVVNGGADQTILGGATATLSANGNPPGGTYAWSPSSLVDCPTCATTDANPPDSTAFIVTYTDLNGCVDTDTVWVFVDVNFDWGIPNAFSPNGDGENDILFVRGSGFRSLNLRVFNRYGQVVFETIDQQLGWNGKHKGKDVNPGVFVYYFTATFTNGTTVDAKGNVTLIR